MTDHLNGKTKSPEVVAAVDEFVWKTLSKIDNSLVTLVIHANSGIILLTQHHQRFQQKALSLPANFQHLLSLSESWQPIMQKINQDILCTIYKFYLLCNTHRYLSHIQIYKDSKTPTVRHVWFRDLAQGWSNSSLESLIQGKTHSTIWLQASLWCNHSACGWRIFIAIWPSAGCPSSAA